MYVKILIATLFIITSLASNRQPLAIAMDRLVGLTQRGTENGVDTQSQCQQTERNLRCTIRYLQNQAGPDDHAGHAGHQHEDHELSLQPPLFEMAHGGTHSEGDGGDLVGGEGNAEGEPEKDQRR